MQLRARTFVQKAVADLRVPRRLARDPAAEGLHRDHLRQSCSRERLVLAPRHVVRPATPIQQLAAVPTSARPSAIPSRHKLAAVPQVPMEGAAAAIWSRGSASLAPESAIDRFDGICPSRSGGRGLLQGSVPSGCGFRHTRTSQNVHDSGLARRNRPLLRPHVLVLAPQYTEHRVSASCLTNSSTLYPMSSPMTSI